MIQFTFAQLEEFVEQVSVFLVGQFHIAFFTQYHINGNFRQVFPDNTAVVRHLEVRVFQCDFVSFPDCFQIECLRGLAASQPGTVRDLADEVPFYFNNGIGRRKGYVDGLIGIQCRHHIVDDTLADQRAYGVVEDQIAFRSGIRFDG